MSSLQKVYKEKIAKELREELGLENVMEVPRLRKIVLNAGIGEFIESKEAVESFVKELTQISGQQPYPRKARKSIAGFKIRQGDVVGYAVTLRGANMWAFLEKLVNVVLPRVRDFKGLNPKSFDKAGNYTVGLNEHVIFPEINPNNVKGTRGLQITFTIDTLAAEHSKLFLEKLGIPFRKGNK